MMINKMEGLLRSENYGEIKNTNINIIKIQQVHKDKIQVDLIEF